MSSSTGSQFCGRLNRCPWFFAPAFQVIFQGSLMHREKHKGAQQTTSLTTSSTKLHTPHTTTATQLQVWALESGSAPHLGGLPPPVASKSRQRQRSCSQEFQGTTISWRTQPLQPTFASSHSPNHNCILERCECDGHDFTHLVAFLLASGFVGGGVGRG